MKIPFDITKRPQIESGEYKLSFEGRPARIICWDKKRSKEGAMLVALIDDGESEHTEYFFLDGLAICPTAPALYIITPEPELTELQRFISECLQKHGLLDCGAADRIAKESAAELLSLARNQLQKEGLVTMEHLNKACEAEYQSGLADGKAKALKDLPRWKKIGRGNNYSSEVKFAINGRYLEMNDTLNDVYEVALSDLEKLPKED